MQSDKKKTTFGNNFITDAYFTKTTNTKFFVLLLALEKMPLHL